MPPRQTPVDDLLALLTKRKLSLNAYPDSSKRSPYDHPSGADLTSLSSFTSNESSDSASSSSSSSLLDSTSIPFSRSSPSTSTHTHKPLPSLPHPHRPPIPPHAIITFLDLLDAHDADVTLQVARVKEGIKEAYTVADVYRAERGEREEWEKARREREKKETNEVGSD